MYWVARMAGCGALVLAACWNGGMLLDPQPIDPPVLGSTQLCFRQDSLVAAAGVVRTPDTDFEILARLLPGGFGGHFPGGLFLVQRERAANARAVAAILEVCVGRRVSNLTPIQVLGVLQGNYDWVQLRTWQARIQNDTSVTLVLSDIDERINRLAVGVPSEAARVQLIGRLGPLRIPAAAVEVFVNTTPLPSD